MARIVRGGLIQVKADVPLDGGADDIKAADDRQALPLIEEAARAGRPGPLPAGALLRPVLLRRAGATWYELAEQIPDGPTTKLMQELAKKHGMVIVVPIYEEEMTGVYYNTAAVIDADGKYLGKYRKNHIPHVGPGFWEKFYFRPGNLGYPVFDTRVGKVGVYICYDRHFPEGARVLGLNGAEIVFNPSATVAGLSRVPVEARAAGARGGERLLRRRDQSRRRRGAVEHRRVLRPELLLRSARPDPRRRLARQGRDRRRRPRLDLIQTVRNTWQFYRDRRPETYGAITAGRTDAAVRGSQVRPGTGTNGHAHITEFHRRQVAGLDRADGSRTSIRPIRAT